MRTARVFPRRTNATPDDDLSFVGSPGLFPPEVDRVEISVAFTWDLEEAVRLSWEWARIAPVALGGPAFGSAGEEFIPGRYLRKGYTITSRGCPNRCDFCHVWRREPVFRELEIKDGWIVQDDNLLACSPGHVDRVFKMLWRQGRGIEFRGLEARRLTDHHVDLLTRTRIKSIFFAFDSEIAVLERERKKQEEEEAVKKARKEGKRVLQDFTFLVEGTFSCEMTVRAYDEEEAGERLSIRGPDFKDDVEYDVESKKIITKKIVRVEEDVDADEP